MERVATFVRLVTVKTSTGEVLNIFCAYNDQSHFYVSLKPILVICGTTNPQRSFELTEKLRQFVQPSDMYSLQAITRDYVEDSFVREKLQKTATEKLFVKDTVLFSFLEHIPWEPAKKLKIMLKKRLTRLDQECREKFGNEKATEQECREEEHDELTTWENDSSDDDDLSDYCSENFEEENRYQYFSLLLEHAKNNVTRLDVVEDKDREALQKLKEDPAFNNDVVKHYSVDECFRYASEIYDLQFREGTPFVENEDEMDADDDERELEAKQWLTKTDFYRNTKLNKEKFRAMIDEDNLEETDTLEPSFRMMVMKKLFKITISKAPLKMLDHPSLRSIARRLDKLYSLYWLRNTPFEKEHLRVCVLGIFTLWINCQLNIFKTCYEIQSFRVNEKEKELFDAFKRKWHFLFTCNAHIQREVKQHIDKIVELSSTFWVTGNPVYLT